MTTERKIHSVSARSPLPSGRGGEPKRAGAGRLALFLIALLLAAASAHAQTIFGDNFNAYANGSSGAPIWKPFLGTWVVQGGEYRQTGAEQYDQGASLDVKPAGKYTISVRTKSLVGPAGGGLFWNMSSRDNRFNCQMVRVDPEFVIWGYEDTKGDFQQTGIYNTAIGANEWHTLAVAVDSDLGKYNVLLDGKIVGRNADLHFMDGYAGVQSSLANAFDDYEIRPATDAETDGLRIVEPFNAPQALAFGPGGYLYVSHRGRDTVALMDVATGSIVRSFAPRGRGEGQVLDPGPIRIDGHQNTWILDRALNRLAVFDDSGKFVRNVPVDTDARDFLLVESPRMDAGTPGSWPSRDLNGIIVATATSIGVRDVNGRNGSGIGPFKDARGLFIDPAGRVLVADAADNTIRILALRNGPRELALEPAGSIPGWLAPKSLAVNSKNQIVRLGNLGYYESGGCVRVIDQKGDRVASFAGFSIGAIGQAGGIAIGPDDTIYVADSDHNRIVIIPSDVPEPKPHVEVAGDTATVTWKTEIPGERVWLGYADPEGKTIINPYNAMPALDGAVSITLTDLKPNSVYRYRISSPLRVFPPEPGSKQYSLLSAPPKGQMQFVTLKIIVAIYLKTDNKGVKHSMPREQLGDRIQRMMARAKEFYLRNTHFKVNLDLDYTVIENAEADIRDAIPPVDQVKKDIVASADFAGKNIKDYDSVVCTWVTPNYKADQLEAVGQVGGGGLTPYGYSAFAADGMVAWLMTHEYNHQVDAFFDRAGYPEFWLNHPDYTIHPGRFGGQYDCNAFIFREWPVNDWFWLPANGVGHIELTADTDGDGVPDNDPRLALDEKRMGSSARKIDTDGDGLTDLQEAMAGILGSSNPRKKDTDGDGVIDGRDPWPLDPEKQARPRKTPVLDGEIAPGEWEPLSTLNGPFKGETYLQWDENAVYLAAVLDQPCTMDVQLTPKNTGLFTEDKIEMSLDARNASAEPKDIRVTSGKGTHGVLRLVDGKTVIEIAMPHNPDIGLAPQMYQTMGLSIQFHNATGWISVFEPWRLWEMRLVQ